MKHVTLTISNLETLNAIKAKLSKRETLSDPELTTLIRFLNQTPEPESELLKVASFDTNIAVKLWNIAKIETNLQKWRQLFCNIPGFDHSPTADIIDQNGNPDWFHQNVILVATFSPTLSHNEFVNNEPFEVRLKDNGKAFFWFPTCEDARSYPNLFNFSGTWEEAYQLLIETLKKGWPMEEFPEELKPLLKK